MESVEEWVQTFKSPPARANTIYWSGKFNVLWQGESALETVVAAVGSLGSSVEVLWGANVLKRQHSG